ncbi:hypothetical protein BGZ47_008002 [Haplosporangium gracile]|nr:hypothetical protein BGZ47_008002 [Haplosporangium gracile]
MASLLARTRIVSRLNTTVSKPFHNLACAATIPRNCSPAHRTLTTLSRTGFHKQTVLAPTHTILRGSYQQRLNSTSAATAPAADTTTPTTTTSELKIHNPQYDEAGKELTVIITDNAVKQLKRIATREKKPLQALRITVDSGGCHGYQYLLDLTDTVNEDDVVFEKDGARVILDTITLPMVSGSRIDYIEELIGSAFKALQILSPATFNFKLGTRSVKTSSASHKRGSNDRRTGPSSKSGGSGGSGYSRGGRAPYDRGSNASSGRMSENSGSGDISGYRSRQPAYVKAHSVSGSQMVQAIESSRQGAGLSKSDNGDRGSTTDPFGSKAADPFANKLEAAIEASLRTTGQSQRSNRADSRHDRTNTYPVAETQVPDIQAQYLVGYARWESVNAKDVDIKNVTPKSRPKIAVLEHGLDRVLFNPGVHWLQDPRSSVFNFDPYLRSICQPKDFDYNALPAYKTSSMDPALLNMARNYHGKYMGSTSSMTSILSQYYFLISGWKPLKTKHLSEAFTAQPKGFTRLSRAPTTVELVHKGDGYYAIDADKTFDSSTVLMQLGKSMEKMLTSTPQEFSRFTKTNSWMVTPEERNQLEAFNYISVDNFLLRSQLDCEDPRLPGKTFDLKTRAAVAIRLDVHNYELNQGYQLRKAHGYLESFEREYYDMMRSAFLKYSLQVRIGQMDGIFVAFHNTARVFGFQYISLDEMDSRLFGSSVMGDECFKNQLRLLNRTLDEITAKYPNQDLRITVDTDETVQSMNVWVETLPLGARTSVQGRNVKVEFDEAGAPEMQPNAELSLWQIVCYSNVNNSTVIGPFDLNERGTDKWELRYKIAELKKPHMISEYRRMKAIQAEIMLDDAAKEALAEKAIEAGEEDSESRRESLARAASRRDIMRDQFRRISEQGRLKEEDEERRQADKEFLIWEPKGYIKISDAIATSSATKPESAPAVAAKGAKVSAKTDKEAKGAQPAARTDSNTKGDSITASMARKLKEMISKGAASPSAPVATAVAAAGATAAPVTPTPAKTTDTTGDSESTTAESKAPNAETAAVYYRRISNGKMTKIPREDLAFIRESYLKPASLSLEDSSRLKHLSGFHGDLIQSLTPYEDIRFKLLEVPVRSVDYASLDKPTLHRIAGYMDIIPPADKTDRALGQILHSETPRFRYKLHLDYYYNWIHKVLALKDDAAPLSDFKEFVAVEDEAALKRVANGLLVSEMMIYSQEKSYDLNRRDAIKKAVLSQIYYAERAFKNSELKEMGYFPRIFDRAVHKTTRNLLQIDKAAGTKDEAQSEFESELKSEPEQEFLSDSTVSSSSSAVVDEQSLSDGDTSVAGGSVDEQKEKDGESSKPIS